MGRAGRAGRDGATGARGASIGGPGRAGRDGATSASGASIGRAGRGGPRRSDQRAERRRGYAPDTSVSRPAQNGPRSSRFSVFPAPDFGSGSDRSSIAFGTL
jgi:hypothetical protein